MSAVDLSVGYPVHAVAEFRNWKNRHGALFVDWKAPCGAAGTASGHSGTAFGQAGSARRKELCKTCWPAGWATPQPKPRQIDAPEVGRG